MTRQALLELLDRHVALGTIPVDPDGTVGILLTQVEMGKDFWPLLDQFQSLHAQS